MKITVHECLPYSNFKIHVSKTLGYKLQNHVFAIYSVGTALECAAKCLREHGCLSFNFKPINDRPSDCHLNKGNRITCPECYRIEPDTIYHEEPQVSTTYILLTK